MDGADSRRIGLVLGGAAALGAYEAGVIRYLMGELSADLGGPPRIHVLSGTSAGAINAGMLAAHADRPVQAALRTCELWSGIRLDRILRPSAIEALWMLLDVTGADACVPRATRLRANVRGGIFDTRRIERLFRLEMPLEQVGQHLRAGRLDAVALAATHVASGRSVIFYQARQSSLAWPPDSIVQAIHRTLQPAHALASASIPLLFPPVTIDGEAYCDGGLRQMVPLAPAIHLGAERLLVVAPLSTARGGGAEGARARRRAMSSPVYLAGKALNALLADRMEADLERLDQVNALLRAGGRRYGPGFADDIAAALVAEGRAAVRPVDCLRIQPSRDLGIMAAEYAGSREFARRERGPAGGLVRRLAAGDPERSGDLLSYLLFDGGFAAQLIDLGRADARAHRAELLEFFGAVSRPHPASAAAGHP